MLFLNLPSLHKFEVIEVKKKHKVLQCTNCGLNAMQFDEQSYVRLYQNENAKYIFNCPIEPIVLVGSKIKILKTWTMGAEYNKLFRGSVHQIVEAPQGEKNGDCGVWVNGTTKPVKVFFDELKLLK